MNILFLSLLDFNSFSERNIYCDLLREFIKNGHNVYCVSPTERKNKISTHFEENGKLLKLKIGNIQKTNIIEKGLSCVSSYSQCVTFGDTPILIGERINPTGKKRFKQALVEHDIDYILKEGICKWKEVLLRLPVLKRCNE